MPAVVFVGGVGGEISARQRWRLSRRALRPNGDAMKAGKDRAPLPLRVGAALPDPPFELMGKDGPAGFDIDLMRRIAEKLGREWRLVPYKGADFNGIFAGLDSGSYDCVASGTTI